MKVLITNVEMDGHSGTTLYVKELALGLKTAGVQVEIFTFRIGIVGHELREAGIRISTRLKKLAKPDVIHAHNNVTAWPVLSHFSDTPVVFWVHNRLSPLDIPPKHSNIMAYLAVDYNCKERYVNEYQFSPDEVEVIFNWVNTNRFKLRESINRTPKAALVFSNYAREDNFLPVIRAACKALNIELEVMGKGTGTAQPKPEDHLGKYDLVFAKAKAAMEAIATGCAVCVCDFTGLAGLVRPENYEMYRRMNFGMKLMTEPITVEGLTQQIHLYEPTEIRAVAEKLREAARFESTLDEIMTLYSRVINQYQSGKRGRYSFNISHYVKCRRAVLRIWIGLWAERHTPVIHKLIRRVISST